MTAPKKVTVYDLENNSHRMTHLNARDMMQHNGWTLTPVDRAAMAKAEAQAKAEDSEEDDVDFDSSAIEKELNGMSKAEMIALAADRFDVRINGRKSEAEVIKTILEAAKAAAGQPAASEAEGEGDEQEGDGEE